MSRLGSVPYLANPIQKNQYELEGILKKYGVKNVSLAGPGAFARTIPNEILIKIMNDPEQKQDFLEFCHMYDSNPYVCGMGKDNLFAKGTIN